MNLDDLMSNLFYEAFITFDVKSHKKYGESIKSTQLVSYDAFRIVGKVQTKDGKVHRMTIKNWKKEN